MVRHTLVSEGVRQGQLCVAVVTAAEMRRLHARWLKRDRPTDVLTFDLRDKIDGDADRRTIDGEVIVCVDEARRIARINGLKWQEELLLYVVHGCLHLCGYDDARAADARRMHRREDELLTELGYGPVFDRGIRGSKGPRGRGTKRNAPKPTLTTRH